jgi:hypothetical protein
LHGENLGQKIKTLQIRQQFGFVICHHHIIKVRKLYVNFLIQIHCVAFIHEFLTSYLSYHLDFFFCFQFFFFWLISFQWPFVLTTCRSWERKAHHIEQKFIKFTIKQFTNCFIIHRIWRLRIHNVFASSQLYLVWWLNQPFTTN